MWFIRELDFILSGIVMLAACWSCPPSDWYRRAPHLRACRSPIGHLVVSGGLIKYDVITYNLTTPTHVCTHAHIHTRTSSSMEATPAAALSSGSNAVVDGPPLTIDLAV